MPTDPTFLVRLTRALARVERDGPLPLRLCWALVDLVEAEGGAISLGLTPADRTLLCATDDEVARIEEAQIVLRQGPSLDAAATASPVRPPSVQAQSERWPDLVGAVPSLGRDRLLHALPMMPRLSVIGVLVIHEDPARLPALVEHEMSALADAVGSALLAAVPPDADEVLWGERDRVSQATGMVVAQLRLRPDDALAVLRAHAFAGETTLAEVCGRVLARRLDFSEPVEGR